jgi:hypothetical protein
VTALAGACALPQEPSGPPADGYDDCTAGGDASFIVTVVDSITAAPIASGATLTWSAGRSSGTSVAMQPPTPGPTTPLTTIQGPYGRPGTFNVTVQKSGYQDWKAPSVYVQQGTTGHCSIQATVVLSARMQPK